LVTALYEGVNLAPFKIFADSGTIVFDPTMGKHLQFSHPEMKMSAISISDERWSPLFVVCGWVMFSPTITHNQLVIAFGTHR